MKKAVFILLTALAGAMIVIAPATLFARPKRVERSAATVVSAAAPRVVPDSLRALYAGTDALKALLIRGDSLAARRDAEAALAADSTYAPAHSLLARLHLASHPQRALYHARKAYESDTTDIHNLEALAGVALQSGDYAGATQIYTDLTRRTTNPDHFRILALLHNSAGRPYTALATLDSAEVRVGRLPHYSMMRRQLYIATRQMDKAVEEAERLVAEVPYMSENHVALAELYAGSGRDSLALASFAAAAIALDSTAVMPRLALGEFYQKRGRVQEYLSVMSWLFESDGVPLSGKISQFEQITSDVRFYRNHYFQINILAQKLAILYPADREVADLYSRHLIASGEVEQAAAVLKPLLAEPHTPTAEDFMRVISIENHLGRKDSVVHYLDRALARHPDNLDLWAQRGHIRRLAGDNDGAIKAYREAMRHAAADKGRSELWGYIGDAEHDRGGQRACYKAYGKALRHDAENAAVLNNYAYFLALDGERLEEALSMAELACRLSESNATYLDTLAWVLYRLGRYEEAKRSQQQALSLDRTNSPELALHYGDILDALGEEFMARTYWRRALERGADAVQIERRIEEQGSRHKDDKNRQKQ